MHSENVALYFLTVKVVVETPADSTVSVLSHFKSHLLLSKGFRMFYLQPHTEEDKSFMIELIKSHTAV